MRAAVYAVLFLVLAALLAGTFLSTPFQQCLGTPQPAAGGGSSYLVTLISCGGHFAHQYGDAVTAIFTVVLAVSTTLLWGATTKLFEAGEPQLRATERSADAAKLAAEIAQAQLKPILWPRITERTKIGWPRQGKEGAKLEGSPRIELEFENLGGSVAILESVCFSFVPSAAAPRAANESPIDRNRVVRSGSFSQKFMFTLTLSDEQMSAILRQSLFLWLYGTVVFADVRGTQWETEFCFRYDGAEASLAPYPPERNKCIPRGAHHAHFGG